MLKTKLLTAAITSVAVLAAVPSAHAATDYFMTVTPVNSNVHPPVEGETQDTYYKPKKAIEISSFRWSAQNPVSVGTASGGAGAGKAQFGDLTVEKAVDSTTPAFFKYLASGQHLQNVRIYARKAGDTASAWTTYSFGTVVVKAQEQNGAAGDDVPTETLTFAYGAVGQQVNRPVSPINPTSKVFEAAWSQILNKAPLAADLPFT
jgi:type VI secretion system secreted protein Hcp